MLEQDQRAKGIDTENRNPLDINMDRREFVVGGVAVVGAIASWATGLPGILKVLESIRQKRQEDLTSSMNSEELKKLIKEIEENFHVEILPATFIPDPAVTIDGEPDKIPTIDWEEEDLRRLASALEELPAHFYNPREVNGKEEKVSIAINEVVGLCSCFTEADSEFHKYSVNTILLKKDLHRTASFLDDQELQGREPALFQLVHEFAHLIVGWEIYTEKDKYTRLIFDSIGGREGIVEFLDSENTKRVQKNSRRLNYSLFLFPKEFIPVAAEVYVRGREYFLKTYDPLLGRERSEKFYEGMRLEIFRGREY